MKSLPQSCTQCFEEFKTALEDLRVYTQSSKSHPLTDNQTRELIINFEVAHELALKVITKYFEKEKKGPFSGSRDATVEAFHADLIDDGKGWLDMIIDRIQYNPVYPINTQKEFINNIINKYIRLLNRFEDKMEKELY
ncbi:nucleotidyltransferase substrate binding protein [Algoriphagus zhangzhouensis]|uniref:Nucleotidyltransferase substrate binding protein, HI0074 family n=1 Tax=Algoriphagus zhangzhouensis TaxID=1073327 RepID=A0A1M7ZKM1_9BACT|nr:nucleotidyltransferase substrate binding protein [Algoriphagus zhangzhouensis]TDY43113.1 nucleotidyltransferase substrate binding protein (TIGR01987 family) [Algoriphagus zhangzhouensis]SHO65226.1 nucleotidyltransferase substrate binding protein, HI0074 family [Algoriphagus zhangzhouensis]